MTAAGNALRAGLLALAFVLIAGCATPPPVADPPVLALTVEPLRPGMPLVESPPTFTAAAAPAAPRSVGRPPSSGASTSPRSVPIQSRRSPGRSARAALNGSATSSPAWMYSRPSPSTRSHSGGRSPATLFA